MKRKVIITVLLMSLFHILAIRSEAQPNPGSEDPDSAIAVVCPGSSVYITSNLSGSSYQWQVNTDNSFENIINNSIYSGTNGSKLLLTTPPTSWYGYRFRCLVDAAFSISIPLKFLSIWTGFNSTAWENTQNWNCNSTPDANTNVIIYSGAVLLSSNTLVRSLKVNSGASLTVNSGYSIVTTK